MNKSQILKLVEHQMESNITEIRLSLDDYEAAANNDEKEMMDPEDFSQQSEKKELQYQMKIQLDHAQSGLDQLREISEETFSVAKAGALIETDANYFLLGISFPSVSVGKKDVLGVSAESPAYSMINGKSKGDAFKLGKNTFTISGIS